MTTLYTGITLFLLGFAHRLKPIQRLEPRLCMILSRSLRAFPGARYFQEVWFLGRTPFTLIFLAFLLLSRPPLGLIATLVFTVAVVLERVIKRTTARSRPFLEHGVPMKQPRQPSDPSFPSGDCLRVWFLTVLTLGAFHPGWPAAFLVYFLALSVTLGRVAMGVHYPSDILGGMGLGFLAAKGTLLLWQTLPYPF